MAKERLSIRGYARHRGVNHNAVRKAIAAGRITQEKDGKIDPEKADREWEANTDPTRAPSTAPKKGTALQSGKAGRNVLGARLRKLEAEADLAEMKVREKVGEWIEVAVVESEVFRLFRQVRDSFRNWPARYSAQITAEIQRRGIDHRTVNSILEEYIDRQLEELGNTPPSEFRPS